MTVVREYLNENIDEVCNPYRQGFVAILRQEQRGSSTVRDWLDKQTLPELQQLETELNALGNAYDGENRLRDIVNAVIHWEIA